MKSINKTQTKQKPVRPNPFKGANDVYLTKNKIAVTRMTTKPTKRGYELTKKVKYYTKNDRNLKQLKSTVGDVVRVGRTGNRYAKI